MAFYRICLGDIMNQVPEVQAVLSALTDYISELVSSVVLASVPILGVLYGFSFFLWWIRRKKK